MEPLFFSFLFVVVAPPDKARTVPNLTDGDGDGDGGEVLGESEAGAVRKGAEKETESMVRKLRNASGQVDERKGRGLWGVYMVALRWGRESWAGPWALGLWPSWCLNHG